MHIGVLTHNYPRFQGDFSGTFVEALCQEFAAQGQQVTVWAPFDPAYQGGKGQGARSRGQGAGGKEQGARSHSSLISGGVDLRLYRYAWPDSLHRLGYMRTMQSDLNLRLNTYFLSPALFAAGIATVLRQARTTKPHVLHAHWLLPNGFIGAVVSRQLGIPLVISVPGSDAQVAGQNPLFRAMARFAFRQASLLTANSAELRDSVVKLGADPHKFDLILYGTDPNALRPDTTGVDALRTRLQLPSDAVIFLCVGRMVYKKGFDFLLRALAEPNLRNRKVVAVMIGNGDQKAEWEQLAAQLGIADRVLWVGNVPKDEIGVYYNLADVLLNPSVSRPADGLNVCVLDAMSCGKPVVGSNVAGNPLAIVDGETGFIVPEQDAAALATALTKLVDNAVLRQRMGAAARWRIEHELGWPHLAARYIGHFEKLQQRI